jgi:hypothetical protein|uniref:Uncharacterized protein n=1 Tax=Bionectria ochroleuca TaxID=29856 RepID=A0A8H7NCJ2_BIOOC
MVAVNQLGLAAALVLGLAVAAPIDKTAALVSRADTIESVAEPMAQRDDEVEEDERSVNGADRIYVMVGDHWGDKKTHSGMRGGTPSTARIHSLPGHDHKKTNKDNWSFFWGSKKKMHSWQDGHEPSRARIHALPGRDREAERKSS